MFIPKFVKKKNNIVLEFAAEGPYSNDIALILVTPVGGRAFRFSSHVQPICLPDLAAKRAAPEGSWCTVTGWGAQADDALDNLSPVLRAAAVPLLAQASSTLRCAGGTFNVKG